MDDKKVITSKIALGGGCHWCTEAVFQSLRGVQKVHQGYLASDDKYQLFSEGISIEYLENEISLKTILRVHLLTHKSTSNHSRRNTYRSAIYTFSDFQQKEVQQLLNELQKEFKNLIITKVLSYQKFKASREQIQNYYKKNPEKPFCKKYIDPKLKLLQKEFANFVINDN